MYTKVTIPVNIQADKKVDWNSIQIFLSTPQGNVFINQAGKIETSVNELIGWYIECKELLSKVEYLYREYLNIGYNDPAYYELRNNYLKAYKELKDYDTIRSD